jgi:CBS domain containing-hemolysin-like protein
MSAFFSASETAFFSVSVPELNIIKETGPSHYARISYLRADPRRLIITILIGNEIANIAISSIITGLFTRALFTRSEIFSLLVSTFAILMFGDLIPKSIAFAHSPKYVKFASFPLKHFMRIITPFRFLVEKVAGGFFYLFGFRDSDELLYFSESKFRTLVDEGEKIGELDRTESSLIHNIFDLGDKTAYEVMTPVNDVFMIESSTRFVDVVSQIKLYRHSRIPIYRDERNNIIGILYFKEILEHAEDQTTEVNWHKYLREPYFVPETKRLSDLLSDLRKRKTHMSVIIDEFGDVSGIATMEDILEELFGEIRDEYDMEEAEVHDLDERTKVISGKMAIDDFNQIFGTEIEDEEFETIAGFILHLFGYLPKRGEKVVHNGIEFTVERLKGIRVLDVKVEEKFTGGEDNGD